MQTTRHRHSFPHRTLGWLSIFTALGASLIGCPDALRIGAETGSGSGGGSTSGSDGGAAHCFSNQDCAYPSAVCDTVREQCVECLVISDCAGKPGTICSKSQCLCPDMTQTFCPAAGPAKARCVDPMTTLADCGSCGHACVNGCAAGMCADGWSQVTTVGAPDARTLHVAAWDDNDKLMIVWGGMAQDQKATATGGVYDLVKNTWTATSSMSAPSPRYGATAVWTGSEMIVWGGQATGGAGLGTGAAFNPMTNGWHALSTAGAPAARWGHTAVWNGNVMIVWGGQDAMGLLDTGAAYDPVKDMWTPVPTGLSARTQHTAVWTGTSMYVWGGVGLDMQMMKNIPLGDGASLDLGGMKWDPLTAMNAPSPRSRHTAVWTSMSMLIFGGNDGMMVTQDGGQYLNSNWTSLSVAAPPERRMDHTALWFPTSSEMIVWGGEGPGGKLHNTGYRLDTALSWRPIASALQPRARHTAVAAGAQMIVWGGDVGGGNYTNTGGIFDTATK